MNINPNPAIPIEVKTSDTFDGFAREVAEASHVSLRPFGEHVVELEAGKNYPVIALETESIATQEQFAAMRPYIEEAFAKMVQAGIFAPTWLRDIRTLFDLKTPRVPERFQDGTPTKMYLNGDLCFVVQKEPLPEVIYDEPVDQE